MYTELDQALDQMRGSLNQLSRTMKEVRESIFGEDSIAATVNEANNRLFALSGLTKLTETWVQWGLRADSTTQEIDLIIRDYLEYRREKGKELSM